MCVTLSSRLLLKIVTVMLNDPHTHSFSHLLPNLTFKPTMAATHSLLTLSLSLQRPNLLNSIPRYSQFLPLNKLSINSSHFVFSGLSLSKLSNVLQATPDGTNSISSLMSDLDSDSIPMPVVLIDQDSDPAATLVQLSFGDRLGALIDTMKALKDLGLDVSKGSVTTDGAVKQTKLFITLDSGRKVEDPDMLERIRLTIIDNLLKYHPESSERLAMGEAFGVKAPVEKPDVDVATHIHIQDDGPKRSLLYIETADRSGLLMEVIKIMSDINVDVESAEIDTEGLVAKDKFHVSYGGAALNNSLSQVLVNCLRYYLRRPQTDEDSY